jgi:protein ImuB
VLSIFLPTWDVDLLRRKSLRNGTGLSGHDRRGWLLVIDHAGQKRVARCCVTARAAGVHPGMTLAEARAICRSRVSPFDAEKSRRSLELLAQWCLRFSPIVSIDPIPLSHTIERAGLKTDDAPDGLLLEITGAGHLFGGEHLMLAEMATRLRRMGFDSRMAVAPTVGAAWAIARFAPHGIAVMGEAELSRGLSLLPTAALRLPRELCAALKQVGIEHIGHLLKLPRESLLARYGEEILMRMDQAWGRLDEMLQPVHPTDPLSVERIFDGAVIQLEAVMLTVEGLLGELSRRLLEKESGVRGVRLEMMRINASPVSHELVIGRASRDPKHLWKLLRPRVENMHMGYGVEAVRLTAYWQERIRHQQLGARNTGEGDVHDEAFDALLDTLIHRWGSNRVLKAQAAPSYTPEVARSFRPARTETISTEALLFVDRPSLLFERPEPAEAVALVPDHPPSYLQWRGQGHELRSGQGPERIVTAWWGTHRMSTRDYFKVELPGGTWVWAFRELESGRWFVHGMWA